MTDTARLAAILEAETLHRAGRMNLEQTRAHIKEAKPGPVAVLALQRTQAADRHRQALKELHRICVGMDHPDQMQRPTEDEYQTAMANAAAALKENN
jgi:hypothetical protein